MKLNLFGLWVIFFDQLFKHNKFILKTLKLFLLFDDFLFDLTKCLFDIKSKGRFRDIFLFLCKLAMFLLNETVKGILNFWILLSTLRLTILWFKACWSRRSLLVLRKGGYSNSFSSFYLMNDQFFLCWVDFYISITLLSLQHSRSILL